MDEIYERSVKESLKAHKPKYKITYRGVLVERFSKDELIKIIDIHQRLMGRENMSSAVTEDELKLYCKVA